MTPPTKQDRVRAAKLAANKWNAEHPIGTVVIYDPQAGAGDFSLTLPTRTKAWVLSTGHAMVGLQGRIGGVPLKFCRPAEGGAQQ